MQWTLTLDHDRFMRQFNRYYNASTNLLAEIKILYNFYLSKL